MKKKPLLILIVALLASSVISFASTPPMQGSAVICDEILEEQGLEQASGDFFVMNLPEEILRTIPPEGILLMPHSGTKAVVSFDPHTGNVLNPTFFPADEVNIGTPIKLIWNYNGTSMFISDQVKKLVLQYSPTGEYQGIFAPPGGPDDAIMSNVRGIFIRQNGNLLVSVSGGANMHSVIQFSPTGEYLGQFIAAGAGGLDNPWDIVYRQDFNDYLVSASGNGGQVLRYDPNGAFLGVFTSGVNFPQQMHLLSDGNLLVATFSSPSGLYEFNSSGVQVGYYGVVGSLRGVHELGNGNILVTNASGVHEINRQNQQISTKLTGQSRWITHIKPLTVGEQYNLNLEVNPAGTGTVTGAGLYYENQHVNINATAAEGYYFVNWTNAQSEVVSTTASHSFQMPSNDLVLTANFAVIPLYTLTLQAEPPHGGTVTGAGDYAQGTMVTIFAEAATGYEFVHWTNPLDEVIGTTATMNYQMPGHNKTLTAHFAELPEIYEVTFIVNMFFSCHVGYETGVTPVYITGTMFNWMEPGQDPAIQQMQPTQDEGEYSITMMLEEGLYEYKYFVGSGWDGGEWGGPPNREIEVDDDMEVFEFFSGPDENGGEVTVLCEPVNGGTATGEEFYLKNMWVSLMAIPNDGFVFEKWTLDGEMVSEDAFLEFCMMEEGDLIFVAHFEVEVGVEQPKVDHLQLFPNPASQTATIRSPEIITDVRLINITGQEIFTDAPLSNEYQLNVSGLQKGIYLVRIKAGEKWETLRLSVVK
jgi:uncharacterized repeat protein (TIGR02543 family)